MLKHVKQKDFCSCLSQYVKGGKCSLGASLSTNKSEICDLGKLTVGYFSLEGDSLFKNLGSELFQSEEVVFAYRASYL